MNIISVLLPIALLLSFGHVAVLDLGFHNHVAKCGIPFLPVVSLHAVVPVVRRMHLFDFGKLSEQVIGTGSHGGIVAAGAKELQA